MQSTADDDDEQKSQVKTENREYQKSRWHRLRPTSMRYNVITDIHITHRVCTPILRLSSYRLA